MRKLAKCALCHYEGTPKKVTPGTIWLELFLWLCFIVPGLFYSFWRMSNRHYVCRRCKAKNIWPIDQLSEKQDQNHSQS